MIYTAAGFSTGPVVRYSTTAMLALIKHGKRTSRDLNLVGSAAAMFSGLSKGVGSEIGVAATVRIIRSHLETFIVPLLWRGRGGVR